MLNKMYYNNEKHMVIDVTDGVRRKEENGKKYRYGSNRSKYFNS